MISSSSKFKPRTTLQPRTTLPVNDTHELGPSLCSTPVNRRPTFTHCQPTTNHMRQSPQAQEVVYHNSSREDTRQIRPAAIIVRLNAGSHRQRGNRSPSTITVLDSTRHPNTSHQRSQLDLRDPKCLVAPRVVTKMVLRHRHRFHRTTVAS